MTRSNPITLRQEMQIVVADIFADEVEFEADGDFEYPSYIFGDFDDLYGDEPYEEDNFWYDESDEPYYEELEDEYVCD